MCACGEGGSEQKWRCGRVGGADTVELVVRVSQLIGRKA